VIAWLAARQHGVVARYQLLELGLTRHQISERIKSRRLHRIHRGVYAVGHPRITRHGHWMAAVLACGPHAELSHHSAAANWAMRDTARTRINVTSPTCHSVPGVRSHVGDLNPDEVTIHNGIPTTTVSRTILDLAADLQQHQLETTINQADFHHLTDPLSLPHLLARHPCAKGRSKLTSLIAANGIGRGITRSALEDRFLSFLNAHSLTLPRVNFHIDVGDQLIECDCVWPEARLVVELDGRAAHDNTRAFERDRARDRLLSAAGWRVIRVTWRQLHEDDQALATDLDKALASDPTWS
jgi:very-short-patch-repair endonuclease